jgi:hypothetical protein
MLSLRGILIFLVAVALLVGGIFLFWPKGQPRRVALQSISKLASDLANPNESDLLNAVVIPVSIQSQTQAEQEQFISKVLADEISPAGVLALKRHGQFGPAKSIFPDEYAGWCQRSGINPDDCVGFRMERAGIHAEVLLVHEGQGYRIVRCNNVKQMAGGI